MKKIVYILFYFFACVACEEKVGIYSGDCGIYFDTKEMYLDTIFIPWGLKNSDVKEQTLNLRVCLFGDVADYDRKFKVTVVADETDSLRAVEGIDFRPIETEYIIPAKGVEALIEVTLLRRDSLSVQPRRFSIELEESPELKFLFTREQTLNSTEAELRGIESRPLDFHRVIYMDERFKYPNWWPLFGESIFGTYSARKCILICDQMNINREVFVAPLSSALTQGYLKFVGKYMHRWLQEHPQEDENGEPMTMGVASQN